MKKNVLITVILLGLFSVITAFKVPNEISNDKIIIAADVSDDYETVMQELEDVEKQIESEMTEDEKLYFAPVVALVTRSAAVVRATVAVSRAAVAVSRAASRWVAEATRNSSGQLLTTIFGIAKVNKIPNSEYYNRLAEFQLYQLG